MSITISNSQVYFLGFPFKKHFLQFVGNDGIYSVGKEFGKANTTFCRTECFAGTSRVGPSRKTLMKLTAWHDSSTFCHVLYTWSFRGSLLTS